MATSRKEPLLPGCHTSILSPHFKYVPAACTNVAATFARVRAERLRAQSAAGDGPDSNPRPAGGAELGIEVLEAAWISGPGRSAAPGKATHADDKVRLTLLHGRGAGNG